MGVIIFIASLLALWVYRVVAPRWQQIDVPRARSSHTSPTVRSAGLTLLPLVAVFWWLGYLPGWASIGILFAGLTGLAADHEYMPPWTRLLLYAIAWVFLMAGYSAFGWSIYWVVPIGFFALAWVNLYNFMDGINGMLALYSLGLLVAFYLHPALLDQRPLIVGAAAWVVAYAVFNVRKKALLFAGDVGAIALACIVGVLLLQLIARTEQWWYLLWVAVYLTDSGGTLVWRILHKHNLFTPHRNHLYQYLANEVGWHPLLVAAMYAGLQCIIISALYYLHLYFSGAIHIVSAGILSMVGTLYILIRWKVHKRLLMSSTSTAVV